MNLICVWNVKLNSMLSLHTNDRCGRPIIPLECQMTKRKPATASKHAHGTKIAAQRANQAIIKSPKPSRLRSVAADPIKSSPKDHNKQEALIVAKQEAPIVESPATVLQDSLKQT